MEKKVKRYFLDYIFDKTEIVLDLNRNFKIEKDDLIVDCGANVGNLFLSLNRFVENFNYTAFEPDPDVFKCLELNLNKYKNTELHFIGLSNDNKNRKFYVNPRPSYADNNSWLTVLSSKKDIDTIRIIKSLIKNRINVRKPWLPNHLQKPFKKFQTYTF